MVLCSLPPWLRAFLGGAARARSGRGLQMPPQWGAGSVRGQNAPGQRSEGRQSPPSVIRGEPDLRLLGAAPQGAQVRGLVVAHLNMLGKGQGWGLASHQGLSPITHSSQLPPRPPASSGIVLLRVSQLPTAVQGTSKPISSHLLPPTAASLALCPGLCPPDQLPDSLILASTLKAHSSSAISAHLSLRMSFTACCVARSDVVRLTCTQLRGAAFALPGGCPVQGALSSVGTEWSLLPPPHPALPLLRWG